MKIQVLGDDGRSGISIRQATKTSVRCLPVTRAEGRLAARSGGPRGVGSSRHRVDQGRHSGRVARIETELGAHPAFTWAQTKLGNAVAHLEAYVAGTWTEPDHRRGQVAGTTSRGMIVPPD
jgi:hypothetical protein